MPGPCRPVAEFWAWSSHVDGSGWSARHSRACTVVGFVPVTTRRTASATPGRVGEPRDGDGRRHRDVRRRACQRGDAQAHRAVGPQGDDGAVLVVRAGIAADQVEVLPAACGRLRGGEGGRHVRAGCATLFSRALVLLPAVPLVSLPLPGVTAVLPVVVQAPPVSALPQPLLTVRLNVSCANTPGADGVTTAVDVAVLPELSVTVSVTVYEPGE